MNINVQENWTIEPELTEMPPRRVVASEYPDLNRPNPMIMYGAGGVLIIGGIILLVFGLTSSNTLNSLLGILVTIAGVAIVVLLGPFLTRRHLSRGEHLVKNGVPVMARLLSAENMSGDYRFGRSVTYQVALPNGEIMHRHVNADDRLLPRKIPANVTALMDVESSDVELYCALPFHVAPNPAVLAARAAAAEAPVGGVAQTVAGQMGTIAVVEVPTGTRQKTQPEQEQAKPQPSGNAGLPWE
jgi:hypothetical protein